MFTDEQRCSVWEQARQDNLSAFRTILTPAVMAETARISGVPLTRTVLNPATLVWLGLKAALQPAANFCRVLLETLNLLRTVGALPRPVKPPAQSPRRSKGRKSRRVRKSKQARKSKRPRRSKRQGRGPRPGWSC